MTDNMTLAYNGQDIRTMDDMLCLTDMWRAAGAPSNKRPAEWTRYDGAPFIEAVCVNLNMGTAHIDVIRTVRGGKDPATWAHWQIGIAYAKYLSHDFHMWCNSVVRAHMEGAYHAPSGPSYDEVTALLTSPDTIIRIATSWKEEKEKREALEAVVKENAPKVEFYDNFANADGLYGLQNAARALSARPNLFVRWLKRDYLFYQGRALVPRVKYRQMDIFDVRVEVVDDKARQRTFVTPKGLEYLSKRMPPEIRMKHDVCGELGLLTHTASDARIGGGHNGCDPMGDIQ